MNREIQFGDFEEQARSQTSATQNQRTGVRLIDRIELGIACACAAIACVRYALAHGQDLNWDQLNYHVYSGYALLHNRGAIDIIPSQAQTWLNPFCSILQYAFLMNLPPRTASTIFAIIASLSLVILYFIVKSSLNYQAKKTSEFSVLLCAALSVSAFVSPMFLSELGGTFNDYIGAVLILLAILLIVKNNYSNRVYLLSGLLIGVALDVKLTNAFYLLGWVAAVVIVEKTRFFVPLLLTGSAVLTAYLPIGGLWNAYVYWRFRNPLFPNYNHIFRSSDYFPKTMLDERWKPKSLLSALDYLPRVALGDHPTNELYFRDLRFLLGAVLFVLALPRIVSLISRTKDTTDTGTFKAKDSLFVIVFVVSSFALWLFVFGVERYAVLLEQMFPLLIVIILSLLCTNRRIFTEATVISLAVIMAATVAPNWGRAPFRGSWFDVRLPAPLTKGGVLYVMLSDEPTAYVIPFFPESDSFARIEGNMPLDPSTGLGRKVLSRIAAQNGEIRTLSPAGFSLQRSAERLKSFGLRAGSDECLDIETKAGKLQSCPLERGV